MQDSNAADVVRRAYDALQSGDAGGFLNTCGVDIEWVDPGIKGLAHHPGPVRGRDAVAQVVEMLVANEEEMELKRHNVIAQGNRVFVEGTWRARAKPTGKVFQINFVHALTVRDGRIQKWEGYWDTAAHAEAFRS